MKKLLLTTLLITIYSTKTFSQVGIGTTNPSASSALDIKSTNSGLLIPRVSLASTTDVLTIASPATSLLVYNTATVSDVVPGFYYWDTKWNLFQDSKTTTDWKVSGNAISTGNFLGTTNNEDLLFKVNNNNAARFDKYNSVALGFGSNVTPGIIRASVLGYGSSVSSPQSIALGNEVRVSGQFATAVGYQAQTSQDYAVILGSTNANSKIGIGTYSPDERLHVVGSIKMVDGNQAHGNILRSDANGKARWETITDLNNSLNNIDKKYGELFRTSNATLSSSNEIPFGSNGPNNDVILSSTNIKVSVAGDYQVTYTINFSRNSNNGDHSFYLRKNSTKITGSTILETAYNAERNSNTKTKLVTLAAGDTVSVYYEAGDSITLFEGTSLQLELIK